MNTPKFSCLVIGLVLSGLARIVTAQSNPMAILQKLYDNRDGAKSIRYDVDFRMKSFSQEDTVLYRGNVQLLRKPDDTIFHSWFSLDLDSIWFGYDGGYIYFGDRLSSELTRADPVRYPGVFIQSTFYGNLIEEGFLNTQRKLIDLIQSNSIEVEFVDTLCQGVVCLGLLIPLPDQEGFTGQRIFMAIDPIEGAIRQRSYRVFFQENEQYQEWNFSNTVFSSDTHIPALEESSLEQYAMNTIYNPDSIDENENTSDANAEAIQLKGILFTDRSEVNIIEVQTNYLLLDFWYASCYPCIKSIPHINKLHAALKDKNVAVFGINPIDKLEKDAARLERFMRNNPMSYPTIMPDEECKARLNVPGYPTFLILDKDRKIIYSSTGFSETLYEEVMEFLEPLVK